MFLLIIKIVFKFIKLINLIQANFKQIAKF
jgi:hypothetical protein